MNELITEKFGLNQQKLWTKQGTDGWIRFFFFKWSSKRPQMDLTNQTLGFRDTGGLWPTEAGDWINRSGVWGTGFSSNTYLNLILKTCQKNKKPWNFGRTKRRMEPTISSSRLWEIMVIWPYQFSASSTARGLLSFLLHFLSILLVAYMHENIMQSVTFKFVETEAARIQQHSEVSVGLGTSWVSQIDPHETSADSLPRWFSKGFIMELDDLPVHLWWLDCIPKNNWNASSYTRYIHQFCLGIIHVQIYLCIYTYKQNSIYRYRYDCKQIYKCVYCKYIYIYILIYIYIYIYLYITHIGCMRCSLIHPTCSGVARGPVCRSSSARCCFSAARKPCAARLQWSNGPIYVYIYI